MPWTPQECVVHPFARAASATDSVKRAVFRLPVNEPKAKGQAKAKGKAAAKSEPAALAAQQEELPIDGSEVAWETTAKPKEEKNKEKPKLEAGATDAKADSPSARPARAVAGKQGPSAQAFSARERILEKAQEEITMAGRCRLSRRRRRTWFRGE